MLLRINHTTRYHYAVPASYALLQIRLRPITTPAQTVLTWSLDLEGADTQAQFSDQFGNLVDLVLLQPNANDVAISFSGEIETHPSSGVVGVHSEVMPLWYYRRQTVLTRAEVGITEVLKMLGTVEPGDVQALHRLSTMIRDRVTYETGQTDTFTTAETALSAGRGVCQDHSHIFISAAREIGFPARYVSGYLMMNDRVDQDASHAWAEAFVEGLGWVGFDISNGISPDERYVKIAHGLDYGDAAPSSGVIIGAQQENLIVSIQVQQ